MTDTVLVGLLSLIGTLIGTLGGIVASSSLTNYRLKQLETKVDRHNSFATRVPSLENRVEALEHRVEKLENFHMHN